MRNSWELGLRASLTFDLPRFLQIDSKSTNSRRLVDECDRIHTLVDMSCKMLRLLKVADYRPVCQEDSK